MNKGEAWVLTAEVELAPKSNLVNTKGVEVPASDTSVSDADVDEELANMQQGQSELVLVDEAAKNGDTVVYRF